MEIIITMSKEGKFSVNKTDDISIFTGIGMLELAKKVMLTPEDAKEVEEAIEEEEENVMQ